MGKLPTLEEIEEWIDANPDKSSRRDIARAFGLESNDKEALIGLMRDLSDRKSKAPASPYRPALITGVTDDGDLVAELMGGGEEVIIEDKGGVLGVDDEVLLHLDGDAPRIVRKINRRANQFMARFEDSRDGGRLVTLNKGRNFEYRIAKGDFKLHFKLHADDLVMAEEIPARRGSRDYKRFANVIKVIGNGRDRHILSQIAIHEYALPVEFSEAVINEAKSVIPSKSKREDLTGLPFLTIDPHDARDHDDAVYVERLEDGFRLWVAIADVAAFVPIDGALDREARLRGNSVYFPDQVIPMLPDHLSGDLCSLHEGVARPVLFVAMDIGADGRKTGHRFGRGHILSRASLAYETAQAIEDDEAHQENPEIVNQVKAAFACYRLMAKATEKRGALHLDLPEQKIELNLDGRMIGIGPRERLDAHKLIEEAMVLANVAAAETLEQARAGLLYRIHEPPKPEKLEALRLIAKSAGYKMARSSGVSTAAINALLDHAAGHQRGEAISMQVLRSLRQARYAPKNAGHFGLALRRYAHFTSPIRRYADLVVHRALVAALDLGEDGHIYDPLMLEEISDHISNTERTAMQAERDTIDRYVAQFMQGRIGDEMKGRISGLNKFGIFVTLDETRADGFVPLNTLYDDHYRYERSKNLIRGRRLGRVFKLGQEVLARVHHINVITGAIELQLMEHEGKPVSSRAPFKKSRKKSNKAKGKRRNR